MASLGLHGTHNLTNEEIDLHVSKTGIGCYALGYVNTDNTFVVQRVGRSDNNLNKRLHNYVPEQKYTKFKFGFVDTVKDGFEHECKMWHDFSPGDNPNHPDKPNDTNYPCPVVNCPH